MRKNITDKKHKKKQHHKTIKNKPKHTRKYHAKRHHRRTRRQGGMIQRMCRGLSCMRPPVENEVVVPRPIGNVNIVTNDEEPQIDVVRKIHCINKLLELTGVIRENLNQGNQNENQNIIIKMIEIIDEIADEQEQKLIRTRLSTWLLKNYELVVQIRFITFFDIVIKYVKEYKRLNFPENWNPTASESSGRRLIVQLIKNYFAENERTLAEIQLQLEEDAELAELAELAEAAKLAKLAEEDTKLAEELSKKSD